LTYDARMRRSHSLLACALVSLTALTGASHARAQEGLSLGALVLPMPTGRIETRVFGGRSTEDADPALGLAAWLDLRLHRNFSLGFVPQLTFNVKADGSRGDPARELDLLVRATAWVPVAPTVDLHLFAAPGYSLIFLPDDLDGFDNPRGFVLQFGAGASFSVTRSLSLIAQLGYQFGDQETEGPLGIDVDVSTKYLHVGFGLLTRM
jgi:hypothetical protein